MAERDNATDNAGSVAAPEGLSLSRWSRLKRQAAAENRATVVSQESSAPNASTPTDAAPAAAVELKLPPLSSISLAEDFTPFMQAKVPQALKQQALKALFKAPHFNVMDGLDIYIDDYTQFEPIAPEVMATLSSWQTIMNPTKQIVTDGGYAVDKSSDEGQATLAARAAEDATRATDEAKAEGASPEPNDLATTASPVAHPRHGKRVGEFAYVDTPPDTEISPDAPSTEKSQ